MTKTAINSFLIALLLAACATKEERRYIKDYAHTNLSTADVGDFLESGMKKHNIPGLAVAILQ